MEASALGSRHFQAGMIVLRLAAAVLAVALTLGGAAPQPVRSASIVVPFDLVDGHIFVTARIGGSTNLRFVVDTGAGDVLAAQTAASLGLQRAPSFTVYGTGEEGERAYSARVEQVELSGAVLRDQHFTVLPLEELRAAEGVERFDGLLGHELFDRYTVRIDYDARTLTLQDGGEPPVDPDARVVPFTFYGTMPEVQGDIDGIVGPLTIDTGDRGSLSLLAPFARQHALAQHYHLTALAIAGWGIGGPVRARLTRVQRLRFSGVEVSDVVARLPEAKHGFFAGRSVAGNVGYGVLRRFVVTFDYARRRMLLAPSLQRDAPDTYDRSGMWLVQKEGGFGVADVTAGGPAADAGLRAGDVIATVDGKTASDIGLASERDALRSEVPGAAVSLHVLRGAAAFDVTLRLSDLV